MPFIESFIHENQNYKIHHLFLHKMKSEFMLLCDVYFKIFIEFKCPCIYTQSCEWMSMWFVNIEFWFMNEWNYLQKRKLSININGLLEMVWSELIVPWNSKNVCAMWLWACNLIISTCLLVFLCVCGCQPWHSNELSGILSTISSYRISAKSPFKQYHFIAGFR